MSSRAMRRRCRASPRRCRRRSAPASSVWREAALQPVRDVLQQQIAGAAAEGIVDEAQPLDVDHDHGVAGAAPRRARRAGASAARRTASVSRARSAGRSATGTVTFVSCCRYCSANERLPDTSRSMRSSSSLTAPASRAASTQHADGVLSTMSRARRRASACPLSASACVEGGGRDEICVLVADERLRRPCITRADDARVARQRIPPRLARRVSVIFSSVPLHATGCMPEVSGVFTEHDGGSIAADRHGEATGLLQQLGAIGDAHDSAFTPLSMRSTRSSRAICASCCARSARAATSCQGPRARPARAARGSTSARSPRRPQSSASMARSSPMVPETKMNGTSGATSCAMRSADRPSNCGRLKSDRMMFGSNSCSALRSAASVSTRCETQDSPARLSCGVIAPPRLRCPRRTGCESLQAAWLTRGSVPVADKPYHDEYSKPDRRYVNP